MYPKHDPSGKNVMGEISERQKSWSWNAQFNIMSNLLGSSYIILMFLFESAWKVENVELNQSVSSKSLLKKDSRGPRSECTNSQLVQDGPLN